MLTFNHLSEWNWQINELHNKNKAKTNHLALSSCAIHNVFISRDIPKFSGVVYRKAGTLTPALVWTCVSSIGSQFLFSQKYLHSEALRLLELNYFAWNRESVTAHILGKMLLINGPIPVRSILSCCSMTSISHTDERVHKNVSWNWPIEYLVKTFQSIKSWRSMTSIS